MGACLNVMTVDGKASKEEVTKQFNARCEQDGYECGHSYSGSFSEFRGLRFTNVVFHTEEEAEKYIDEYGEKWGPAVVVRHKVFDTPKSVLNHMKARTALSQKIHDAGFKLRNAQQKARINNRSTTPSYVTKAENAWNKIKETNQPKIDARTAKIDLGMKNAGMKSKKFVWMLGGWCSS